jgi:hypothetical protein
MKEDLEHQRAIVASKEELQVLETQTSAAASARNDLVDRRYAVLSDALQVINAELSQVSECWLLFQVGGWVEVVAIDSSS